LDEREAARETPRKSAIDQAAEAVDKAIERGPSMPLYSLSRWTRQAPLQALAFLVGVLVARRR
jgi:hypothetical protein